jgi:hypothetical protein
MGFGDRRTSTCEAPALDGEGDDGDMRLSSKHMPQPKPGAKFGQCLIVLASLCSLSGSLLLDATAARAQNIDEGKSAPRLFADTCVNCHRSPNGLAKGRFRPTLFMFLQDHYTASSGTAWELSAYLASLDTPPGKRARSGARHSATATSASSPRPPAPVRSAP